MARLGMDHFLKLASSLKRLNKDVEDAKERGGEKVTVSTRDLEQVTRTLNNFDVQILNKRAES